MIYSIDEMVIYVYIYIGYIYICYIIINIH
jgi:hypothetical protein